MDFEKPEAKEGRREACEADKMCPFEPAEAVLQLQRDRNRFARNPGPRGPKFFITVLGFRARGEGARKQAEYNFRIDYIVSSKLRAVVSTLIVQL
jgi:hypothetical protein